MPKYVAFLRGINVGGNKKVPMADLKNLLEKNGFKDVRTLLASGNVIFETPKSSLSMLTQTIEALIEKRFGFHSDVILRTAEAIQALVDKDPFQGIRVTPDTRLYVTFLSVTPTSKLQIPYQSPDKALKILSVSDSEVCSVLTVTADSRSVDAMAIIEKEFGKNVTTRNWNTVLKLLK